MTGQKTNWSKMFEGLATSTVTSGLKQGEGMIAKAFGFGSNKPTGKLGDPIHTINDNQLTGQASGSGGIGGIFGSLMRLLHIPGFASGGDTLGGLTLVGERGPEIANLPAGTHISNNSDTRRMLGGVTNHYYIDATGTNPAEVEARVRAAVEETHARSVHSSIQATRELAARRPAHARF